MLDRLKSFSQYTKYVKEGVDLGKRVEALSSALHDPTPDEVGEWAGLLHQLRANERIRRATAQSIAEEYDRRVTQWGA